jgi:hypothetical protein
MIGVDAAVALAGEPVIDWLMMRNGAAPCCQAGCTVRRHTADSKLRMNSAAARRLFGTAQ